MAHPTPLQGKTAVILVGPDFEDREVFYPYYRLQEAGAKVIVAGLGEATYKGKYGVPIDTDGPCEAFVKEPFDAVIIPGGWAPDKIRMNEAALAIVRQANERHAPIASICHGGWVLVSANIIKNRQVTSYVAIKDDMTFAGGRWMDAEVVVDGNLITSRTPADLPAFCAQLVEQMTRAMVTA